MTRVWLVFTNNFEKSDEMYFSKIFLQKHFLSRMFYSNFQFYKRMENLRDVFPIRYSS